MQIDPQQQQAIIQRFNSDEGFRQRFTENPNKAVKEEYALDFPVQMRVVAEGGNYRLEPEAPSSGELSDSQLEAATGGGWGFNWSWLFGGGGNLIASGAGHVISNDGGSFRR